MAPRRTNKTKNPPVLSQEFLIQNHADIVSCVAIVFIVGLMFQSTAPIASMFITMSHNITVNDTAGQELTYYTAGSKDLCAGFFYFLISIVIHAVIQEYVLDKLNRKMHLSKIKHSRFNESGQLLIFFLMSAVWGADIMLRENYITGLSQLWEGYPHMVLPYFVKFFFIIQMGYWLHNYPELYFQKVRKEEIPSRLQYTTIYLAIISAAYFFNFNKVALCVLVLHYSVEALYHAAMLFHFAEKPQVASSLFTVFDVLFVLTRLGSITLAVLTFWSRYGLAQTSTSAIDVATGNYNTALIRLIALAAVCLSQAGLMYSFIAFHLRKMRERTPQAKKLKSPTKKKPKVAVEDLDSLPEVDQNSASDNGSVRRRAKK